MGIFDVKLQRVEDDSYEIEIGFDLIGKMIAELKSGMIMGVNKYVIITDSNCKEFYGDKMLTKMVEEGFQTELFYFEAGEEYKTRETKTQLEDKLLEKGYGRDTCIIALGGGVVTDLVGFLAGTYCRGIPVIYYATTILAAADASIGGKTAVDTPLATNYIGIFRQPDKIYLDIKTWETLPIREVRAGLVETIKHACLYDKDFFEYLEKNIDKIVNADNKVLDKEVCEYITQKNCQIKYDVVIQDEKEENLRQILNLGHTLGRALETLVEFKYNHGECVAIGLVYQARIANDLGYLDKVDVARIENLLKKISLEIEIPQDITTEVLVSKMHTDKKSKNNKIRFVFMESIGKIKEFENGNFSTKVEDEYLLDVIARVRR